MNKLMKPIEHKDLRVLTTAQLAEAYGVETDVINKNFGRNKERYAEGKHYFYLSDFDLEEFSCTGQIDVYKARHLYLWTERGAFLHAKSLNTDQAWEVYEKLLDSYFQSREKKAGPLMLPEKALSLIDNSKYSAEVIEVFKALTSGDPEFEMEQLSSRLDAYRKAASKSDQVTAGFPFFREDMFTILDLIKRFRGRSKYPPNSHFIIDPLFHAGYIEFRRMTPDEKPQKWGYIFAATGKAFEAGVEQLENTSTKYRKRDYYYYWRFPEQVVKEVFLPKWKYMLAPEDPWREGYTWQYRTWDLSEW
jgi:hypothetical protein